MLKRVLPYSRLILLKIPDVYKRQIYWYDQDKNEICKSTGGGISIITKDCNVQSYMNTMYSKKTKGANSLYDKKYDEVWFRLYNESLIYNEKLNVFTSLYTFDPDFTLPLSCLLYTSPNIVRQLY